MGKLAKLICTFLIISLLILPMVGCAKPLTLTITAPTDGATVNKSPVEVRANVSDAKATVWVNDTVVAVTKYKTRSGGYISTNFDLNEGENIIKVTAAKGKPGNWKETVDRTVIITYTLPLSLEITSPKGGAILTESLVAVSGTVSDLQATITVKDMEVEVAEDGTFSADVELTEGMNPIKVVATRGKEVVTRIVNVIYSPE